MTSSDVVQKLKSVLATFPPGPLLVIHNAAAVKSDVRPDGTIDFDAAKEINAVGVAGLANVLRAVEACLLAQGGLFVGISSFAALAPPVREPRVAYAASKAYLDSALRSLRHVWRDRVQVVTVHLGHLGEADTGIPSRWIRPSYAMAADRIVRALTRERVPREINYPHLYTLVYKYLLPVVPDSLYFSLFGRLFGSRHPSREKPST